ncbi:MAG: metallopeptidase family protein [Sedimentisphaerales bacterium]|nr:metallopeptidase family protein [Sedimentisphaerales bacterium]
MKIPPEEFDRLVQEAIEAIPPEYGQYLEYLPVVVQDRPEKQVCRRMGLPDRRGLLGLFEGVPRTQRGSDDAVHLNRIVLYRQNLLGYCAGRRELADQIRKTLIHELGHYLGMDEQQIRQLDY